MSLLDAITANPVSVIIGVLTIATALYLNNKNKKIKSFRYEILTNEPILTSSEEVSGKIKIYYEESQDNKTQIKDGLFLIIRLVNDGNVPINSDDFHEPVSISFDPNADVLSAEIIKTNPGMLKPELEVSKHKIALKPLLLNQKDSITIKTLLMGFKKRTTINVNARIVDVPEIKAVEPKRNYRNWVNFKRLNFDKIYLHYFMPLIIVLFIGVLLLSIGFHSSSIRLNPDMVTAQVGEEKEVAIFVPDETLVSNLMKDRGIIKASFPDYDVQPNITLTIQPNSFLSVPVAAKMKTDIGRDVKAGIYKIALDVLQGFDKRTATVFVEVVIGNRTK